MEFKNQFKKIFLPVFGVMVLGVQLVRAETVSGVCPFDDNVKQWLMLDDAGKEDKPPVPLIPEISPQSFGTMRTSLFIMSNASTGCGLFSDNDHHAAGDLDGYLLIGSNVTNSVDGAYLPRNYDNDVGSTDQDLPLRRVDALQVFESIPFNSALNSIGHFARSESACHYRGFNTSCAYEAQYYGETGEIGVSFLIGSDGSLPDSNGDGTNQPLEIHGLGVAAPFYDCATGNLDYIVGTEGFDSDSYYVVRHKLVEGKLKFITATPRSAGPVAVRLATDSTVNFDVIQLSCSEVLYQVQGKFDPKDLSIGGLIIDQLGSFSIP